ncbi:MAG: M48 family metallopeptidase [Beggiatoa sp.]|nr:M48 family metallopeptidase [Beggiatoa sp.]
MGSRVIVAGHTHPSPTGQLRHIRIGDRVLAYRFRRGRRRTLRLVVDGFGLHAAGPHRVTLAEAESFIREKEGWILKKLAEARAHAWPLFAWRQGARIPYLGREIAIVCGASATRLVNDRLEVALARGADARQLREATIAWLRAAALELFHKRIAAFAPLLGVEVRRVSLSAARTQWGACSTDGWVRLCWRLVHVRLPLVDYVVAHELAHLQHMDHSPRFWRAVASVYPDFAAARRELRSCSRTLPQL